MKPCWHTTAQSSTEWTIRWSGCFPTKLAKSGASDSLARLKERAEAEAIQVFSNNLKDLLLAAPAGKKTVMGIDPGIRTGCKIAVVDATGKLLDTATIYPHAPRNDRAGALTIITRLAAKHGVDLVGVGNGTAGRETDALVAELGKAAPELKPASIMVSEAGASVYSASQLAADEFPNLDVSLRGAISIARRLQDPLAELVKIESALNLLPVFSGYDNDRVATITKTVFDLFEQEDGLDALFGLISYFFKIQNSSCLLALFCLLQCFLIKSHHLGIFIFCLY